MPKAKQDEPRSFEDSMKRLDEIVEQLEEDKLPLDKMIALYEEGVALARACGEKLEAAEQKVKLIAKKAGGAIALEEFDEREEA
ncbi:MAG: exodeoxyribonuclease VII small subunit [Chthoniobacterales bacterium]